LIQLSGNWLISVKPLSDADENVAEVLENAVIASLVCIGQRCSGNRPTKSDVVEFVPMGIQARFNISEALATRNLSIGQTKELVERSKGFDPMLSPMSADTEAEIMPRKKLKQLPENGFAGIHGYPPIVPGKVSSIGIQIENEN
jgi:hypothetical protein